MGISVKRFEGWEPTETHEHIYEGDRLVRTIVTREAEWDDQEQGLLLAYVAYKAQLCPSGHYLPESTDPAMEDQYAGRARRCHACHAVVAKAEAMKDNPYPQALLFGATRRR